jgi:hypothetical protein
MIQNLKWHDARWSNTRPDLIWLEIRDYLILDDLIIDPTRPDMIRNPKWPDTRWSENRPDPTLDDPRTDLTRPNTTWNPKWPDTRWPNNQPDPTQLDPKSKMTRHYMTRYPTRPNPNLNQPNSSDCHLLIEVHWIRPTWKKKCTGLGLFMWLCTFYLFFISGPDSWFLICVDRSVKRLKGWRNTAVSLTVLFNKWNRR